jgi:rubrerythrin
MSVNFNAEEVYRMAEQIERNGIRFYRKAAEQTDEESSRNVLQNLAEMEANHERTFAAMRQELNPSEKTPTTADPDDEGMLYLQAAAEGKVFDFNADPAAEIQSGASLEQMLRQAIRLEHDSIAFYTGMKEMMQSAADRQKVDHIIREEVGHVTMLTRMMGEA